MRLPTHNNRISMRFLTLIIAVCLTTFVNAQTKMSLTDAIEAALKNNYDIELSRNAQTSAQVNNTWGNAGAYPTFSMLFSGNYDKTNTDPDNFNRTTLSGTATVNWTLFNGFAVRITKQRLASLQDQAEENLTILVENTIQSVILGYNDVLLQNEKLKVFEQIMNLSEDRFKRTEKLKELGNAVTYDLLQAKNAYLTDKANYLLQEVTYNNAKRNLKFLLGQNDGKSVDTEGELTAKPAAFKLASLMEKMHSNNTSLKNQYINLSLLQKDIALAKSNFFPKVSTRLGSTVSSMNQNFDTGPDLEQDTWRTFGELTLSYTIYNGGNRKRAVQLAQIRKESGDITLEKIKHTLDNQLANLHNFNEVREALLEVATENMAAAELNLKISEQKFKSGAINSFNYRDIQILYVNAALKKLQAIYNLIDSQTALLRITGGIIQEYQ